MLLDDALTAIMSSPIGRLNPALSEGIRDAFRAILDKCDDRITAEQLRELHTENIVSIEGVRNGVGEELAEINVVIRDEQKKAFDRAHELLAASEKVPEQITPEKAGTNDAGEALMTIDETEQTYKQGLVMLVDAHNAHPYGQHARDVWPKQMALLDRIQQANIQFTLLREDTDGPMPDSQPEKNAWVICIPRHVEGNQKALARIQSYTLKMPDETVRTSRNYICLRRMPMTPEWGAACLAAYMYAHYECEVHHGGTLESYGTFFHDDGSRRTEMESMKMFSAYVLSKGGVTAKIDSAIAQCSITSTENLLVFLRQRPTEFLPIMKQLDECITTVLPRSELEAGVRVTEYVKMFIYQASAKFGAVPEMRQDSYSNEARAVMDALTELWIAQLKLSKKPGKEATPCIPFKHVVEQYDEGARDMLDRLQNTHFHESICKPEQQKALVALLRQKIGSVEWFESDADGKYVFGDVKKNSIFMIVQHRDNVSKQPRIGIFADVDVAKGRALWVQPLVMPGTVAGLEFLLQLLMLCSDGECTTTGLSKVYAFDLLVCTLCAEGAPKKCKSILTTWKINDTRQLDTTLQDIPKAVALYTQLSDTMFASQPQHASDAMSRADMLFAVCRNVVAAGTGATDGGSFDNFAVAAAWAKAANKKERRADPDMLRAYVHEYLRQLEKHIQQSKEPVKRDIHSILLAIAEELPRPSAPIPGEAGGPLACCKQLASLATMLSVEANGSIAGADCQMSSIDLLTLHDAINGIVSLYCS